MLAAAVGGCRLPGRMAACIKGTKITNRKQVYLVEDRTIFVLSYVFLSAIIHRKFSTEGV